MSNIIKIRPAKVVLFHAYGRTDGQTDEDKSLHSQHFEILLQFQCFIKFRKTLMATSKYQAFMPNGPDIIANKYWIYFERPQ